MRMLLSIWVALLAPVLLAQPALRVDSDLVLIPASVVDRQDRLVLDVAPTRFRLFEDRQEQSVTHFAVEEAPVSLAIVFDASRSMRRALPDARAAVQAVLDGARQDDETALIVFSDGPAVESGFDAAPGRIASVLARTEARGGTSLLDALVLAMHYVRRNARHPRRAILLFSDGEERDSRYTWSEARGMAREADVRIYPFLLAPSFAGDALGPVMLKAIAEDSGGRCFEARRGDEFRQAAEQLDLHWQYVLGYRPARRERDGRYHKVEVRLDEPARNSKLKVFWRRGYVAAR